MPNKGNSPQKTPRSKGFSLAELIISMAIVGVILASGFLRISDKPNKATPQTVAHLLAEELRSARQRAMREKVQVAIAIPSANGTVPQSATYYRLEGDNRPRVTQSSHLGREYPGISLFVGLWNLDPSKLLNPAAGNTMTPANDGPSWDFASWGAPYPKDYHLIFSPTGAVYSSNLPLFDNSYHVIVSQGTAYSTTSLEGSTLSLLNTASSPYTVTVSRTGLVRADSGVLAQDGSVALTSGILTPTQPMDPGPYVSGLANSNPVFLSVEIAPKPNPDSLPPGVDATVDWKSYLTLQVRGTDPDADRLSCNWVATPPSGSGPGGFSAPVSSRTEWDGTAWVSTWEWRPPANAVIGDIYTLTPTLVDGRGGSTTGNLGVAGKVQIIGEGQIAFERQGEIFIMNSDGTGETNLTLNPANDSKPAFSPDGTRIAFVSDRGGTPQTYVMWADGTNVTPVSNFAPQEAMDVAWAPKCATHLLVTVGDGSVNERIAHCTIDGSMVAPEVASWADYRDPTWRRDETLAIAAGDTNGELWESQLDSTPPTLVGGLPAGRKWHPRFSPDGKKVVLAMGPFVTKKVPPGSGLDFNIYKADYVPAIPGSPGPPVVPGTPSELTNLVQLTNDPSEDGDPCWSPMASSIVFSSNRTGNHQLYVMDASGGGVKQLTHRAGVDSIHPSWALR